MSGKWYQGVEKRGRTGFVDSLDSEAIGLHVQQRRGQPPRTTGLGTGGGAAEGGDDEFTAGIPTVIIQKCSETTKPTWLTQQSE